MNVEDFIKNVLIKEIGDIKSNHPFLAFSLICSGIELLGKFLEYDNVTDLHQYKSGGYFFKKAIDETFNKSNNNYAVVKDDLWTNLRNGMAHTLLPGSTIGLTETIHNKNEIINPENHPYRQGSQYILVIEYFYNDFVEACNEVIDQKPRLMKQIIINTPKI